LTERKSKRRKREKQNQKLDGICFAEALFLM